MYFWCFEGTSYKTLKDTAARSFISLAHAIFFQSPFRKLRPIMGNFLSQQFPAVLYPHIYTSVFFRRLLHGKINSLENVQHSFIFIHLFIYLLFIHLFYLFIYFYSFIYFKSTGFSLLETYFQSKNFYSSKISNQNLYIFSILTSDLYK